MDFELIPSSGLEHISNAIRNKKEEISEVWRTRADKLYDLGKLVVNAEGQTSMRELAYVHDISMEDLKTGKKLYTEFESKSAFNAYIEQNNITSLTALFKSMKLPTRKKQARDAYTKLESEVNLVLRHLQEHPEDRELFEATRRLRNRINRRVPLVNEFSDRSYLQWSFCCSCGQEDDTGDGLHVLKHNKYHFLKVPICSNCMDISKPVNDEYVMLLYANYALNLEGSFDSLI